MFNKSDTQEKITDTREKSMSSNIKKHIAIYLALVLVLCGMASVSYAITAATSDNYITRAQYVVDMERLQNKIDEKEVTILGKINKLRSTDVKFVTWDTPNKYNTSTGYTGGYYNGGNYFPAYRIAGSSGNKFAAGMINSPASAFSSRYKTYSIYRLWNGDYYLTNGIAYNSATDGSGTNYYTGVSCAVPVENYPGWYLTMFFFEQINVCMRYWISLVKLDPNVPMPSDAEITAMTNSDLQLRFKSALWRYNGAGTTRITSRYNNSISTGEYVNISYMGPFGYTYRGNVSATNNRTLYYSSWVDETTGDYMMTIRNMRPCTQTNGEIVYYLSNSNPTLSRIIPADNVEYVMGGWTYYPGDAHSISSTAGYSNIPDARHIGDGLLNDPYWKYEFVDCENGIKYWHAYKKGTKQQLGTGWPTIMSAHYSLPIVY